MPFRVLVAAIDETWLSHESPATYVERIVDAKLEAVKLRAVTGGFAATLVADTLVTLDGEVFGKPTSFEHAEEMLERLAGRVHLVMTRYKLERADGACRTRTLSSEVEFRALDGATRRRYVEAGEGRDKAGGYALQGKGAALVRRVQGSVSSVIGLPACEVLEDLEALGLWTAFA